MQTHEHNLFNVLCLGAQLNSDTDEFDVEPILADIEDASPSQPITPLQQQVAEWLKISIDDCPSQADASTVLWNTISRRGYTLVDVPTQLRRMAFGGSLTLQKKAGTELRFQRYERALKRIAIKLAILMVTMLIAWYAWKQWGT